MKDDIPKYVIGAVVGAITVALALNAVFGGKDEIPGNLLYHYQTLITGLLALGAAFLTVRQMKRSDEKTAEYHKEQIETQLRPFALKVERLCKPGIQDLLFYRACLDRLGMPPRLSAGEEAAKRLKYRNWLGRASTFCAGIEELLNRPCWTEDSEALDGWTKDLHSVMQRTCRAVDIAVGRRLDFIEALADQEHVPVGQEEAAYAEADFVNLVKILELHEMTDALVRDLRKLAALYKIDVSEFDE